MKFRARVPEPIGFQLAPMLDIVFLLLIFFVVTQTFSLYEPDLKVKVPSAEQATETARHNPNEIIINVREDGTVTINREHFKDKDQLYAKLYNSALLDKDQTIRIRGDAKTEYQKMVDVLDACTKAGFWNVSFSTKRAVPAS